jgi:putative transcriptional regulator
MPKIHPKLKLFRIRDQLTQEDLANRLGVTRQTINAVEQGKYQPSLYLAFQCAKLFGVPVEDLFSFEHIDSK